MLFRSNIHGESDLFYDEALRVSTAFHKLNDAIPSRRLFPKVDIAALQTWLPALFENHFQAPVEFQLFKPGKGEFQGKAALLFLEKNIWLGYDNAFHPRSGVYVFYDNAAHGNNLFPLFEKLKQLSEEEKEEQFNGKFHLITTDEYGGWSLKEFEGVGDDVEITNHYNPEFEDFKRHITDKLSAVKVSGLVLMHGEPGTGKTTFIRYLAGVINKRMIYFPPYMAQHVSDPKLVAFLLDYPDSILVLEDADSVIARRRGPDETSAISNLLNLSDGILSQCLNVALICTFNMKYTQIDDALLRKGRLLGMYEFKPLQPATANALAVQLGHSELHFDKPVTLAEVYNFTENNFTGPQMEQIGFRRQA
ncbi:MAG: AAA family ATPase [Bacteroidota bacterium]